MLGILNGVITGLALLTFLGIIAWAWSKGRAKANHDASMLPFDLPDEVEDQKQKVGGSNE